LDKFMKLTLPKIARLKSKKSIEKLFAEGTSIKKYPLLLIYSKAGTDLPIALQVAFSVSKKRFKRAVARNRIKRLMREAYRLHQNIVKTPDDQKYTCMFLYIGAEEIAFQELQEVMKKLLEKLNT